MEPESNVSEATMFSRQLSILPTSKTTKHIVLIGCGGIGSITALALTKTGFNNIDIYDDDVVELENVASQYFTLDDIGKPKVRAITERIAHTQVTVRPHQEKWDGTPAEIVISAVDSMATRKEIWKTILTKYAVRRYIEARMSGEKMRIYSIDPQDTKHRKLYESTLYDDESASPEECTAKAIAYNTFVIGGLVTLMVKKYATEQESPKEIIFNLETLGYLKS